MGKPDFIIIGVMRSATSTLFSCIAQNPKVTPVEGKEIHFFSDDSLYKKGKEWYCSKFYDLPQGELTGEASPSYFQNTLAPVRISELLPDVKIILCLRNPAERAISHFYWNKKINIEPWSFDETFSDERISETNHYIGNSMYAKSLHWWLKFFLPSQIAVVMFDDIVHRQSSVTSQLYDYLGLPQTDISDAIQCLPANWQNSNPYPSEIVKKINNFLTQETMLSMDIIRNSGVTVIGDPNSILQTNFTLTPNDGNSDLDKKEGLVALAEYSGAPWVPSHEYFAKAEEDMDNLWDNLIWPFIFDCNFSKTLDLAAGHGRNSRKLLENAKAEHLIILDIQPGNIEVCKTRFAHASNLDFIVGSGYDISDIPDNTVSFVYCFDAMVHFEPEVVQSYLKEIHRILIKGGRGFLHHSNYTLGRDWRSNPNGRNYMSNILFNQYSEAASLGIVRQRIISWNKVADIDCLSLVEK